MYLQYVEFDEIVQWSLMLTIFLSKNSNKIPFLRNLNFTSSENYADDGKYPHWQKSSNKIICKCENKFSMEPFGNGNFFTLSPLRKGTSFRYIRL